jgi:dolichol-phosphate mannosyltransferase
MKWEWIVVDDHSSDATFDCVSELSRHAPHVNVIRLARNFGSHTALACGLQHAKGDCAVVLAADLQDPPELIPDFIARWRSGVQIVWGVRGLRPSDKARTVGFSKLYFFLMRRFVGLQNMPPTGSDFFLIDQRVINAFRQFQETNVSTIGLLTWLGFRQESFSYDKEKRVHGKSGWTFEKKIKILVDSVTAFTYKPIRLMSYTGFIFALFGFVSAGFVVGKALLWGSPVQGYPSIMAALLVIGGIQMLMLGVLGEYVWRSVDEARRRPHYIIENTAGDLHNQQQPKPNHQD